MPLIPRPGIMNIAPYVGGLSKAGNKPVIKLSSNENALGSSPKAVEAYNKAGEKLFRYPDGGCTELRSAIGEVYGLDPAQIVCGAGSDELISLLCLAYAGPGDEVLYPEHGFLMYPISTRAVGATPVTAKETNATTDVDNLLAAVTERTKIVFFANPNNPTGSYIPKSEIIRLRQGLPDNVLLVIDGAYAEYVSKDDYTPGQDIVDMGDNTVMTRTFSKIYGLAALRLGWAYCPPVIADVLNRVRGPFNVTSSAQAAGIAAVHDTEFTEKSQKYNDKTLTYLTQELSNLGLLPYPSVCNFLLVKFPEAPQSADQANDFLLSKGIIPRKVANYGFPDCLRITIGKEEENQKLIEALTQFTQK